MKKKMTKKEREELKKWNLAAIMAYLYNYFDLVEECEKACNGGNNTAHSGDNTTGENQAGTTKPTLEAALVYYNPPLMGYLVAVARLLKQALFHKKRVHFIMVW